MAKRLTTQDRIKRARAEGYSRKQLAQAFGVSVSAVGRAERGQTSGATIKAQAEQFFKLGKRAKSNVASGSASLPSAKPKGAPRPKKIKAAPAAARIVTPLERAEGKLSQFDSDSQVVVTIQFSNGKRRTFYATGGIEAGEIKGRLASALNDQASHQGRGNQGGISDPDIDWDDVVDIDIEEY